MEESIFTKIIRGDIPSYKIYEDDKTFAFLDIHPAQAGHTLVVPKIQIDRIEKLSERDYYALMVAVKKIMTKMSEVFGPEFRMTLKVEGFDVPHVHIHIIPCRTAADFRAPQDMSAAPDHPALSAMADRLRL